MIVGATAETDKDILHLSSALYQRPSMKRVYYSGYIPVNTYDNRLPVLKQAPLVRENRLYQADWLLRFYQFKVDEIVNDAYPDLDLEVDPKLSWALRNPQAFPVDINRADYEMLLRVPGIGVKSAKLILVSRRYGRLGASQLKKMGIVMKKAQYFITCKGKAAARGSRAEIAGALLDPKAFSVGMQQLSLDDFVPKALPDAAPAVQRLEARGMAADVAARTVRQEALQCLTKRM